MKLQHLSMGARFEYEGVVYVKTGPLTASSEDGGQRIIPRYAILKALDVPAAEASKSPVKGRLEAVRVRTALLRVVRTTGAGGQPGRTGRGAPAVLRGHQVANAKPRFHLA